MKISNGIKVCLFGIENVWEPCQLKTLPLNI